jgi:phosphopantothenoylcysteine decarboxylase/phosphopantothenate--cysteine ligase
MWRHEGVLRNIASLEETGVGIVHPREEERKAKLADPNSIVAHCARMLAPESPLKGGKVVIIAGSTEEPIDRVRLLSNRSTGGLGIALAEEAFARGAEVVMLLGRHEVRPPDYVEVKPFTSVESLMRATEDLPRDPVAVLTPAAIADYRLKAPIRGKVSSGMNKLELFLQPTPKVLPILRAHAPKATLVSFKLEVGLDDDSLEKVALSRLGKGVEDIVVANDLERVKPDRHPALIVRQQTKTVRSDGPKADLAAAVLDAVEAARG